MLYVLAKEDLRPWLEALNKEYALYVPGEEKFIPYAGEFTLEGKTKLSVKEFFLPWREPYLRFEAKPGGEVTPLPPSFGEQVVFGVRPCDAKGVILIEKVFKEDPLFCARREKTYLVGVMCREPGSQCFGWAMGVDPFAGEGLDLLLVEDGERFLVSSFTERAKKLISEPLRPANDKDKEKFLGLREEFRKKYPPSPALEKLKTKGLLEVYEAPFWEALSHPCLNCGTCTFLCPTCYCFDVQDEVVGNEGVRVRLPDACMFELYSRHASGHNPRRSPLARFRNRFLHKFKYYLDEYGEPLCVGCGRCIEECPAGINLWDVIRAMSEV